MGEADRHELERTLGVGALTVYAIGDILGAGIYALVGKVAAVSGSAAWLSFGVAATLALLTGLTYAELGSRLPLAAGAAAYCRRAFRPPIVAFIVGTLVLASGLSSAATVSRALVGYLEPFITLPTAVTSIGVLALMTLVNYRGIKESARVNLVLTAVEASGLLLVMVVGLHYATGLSLEELGARVSPGADVEAVLSGATVAFFAYIGFEDTVNVAEEVKEPQRAIPRAILTAIVVTSLVYAGVTLAALFTVPLEQLAGSDAPLLDLLDAAGVELPPGTFSLVAILAIGNTGLLNLIMASRLTYGMARDRLLPGVLARVHAKRRTPWVAVLVAFGLAVLLAVTGGVKVLAQTTSFLLLAVFTLLHVALLVLKRREPDPGDDVFRTPSWVPVLGAAACVGMAFQYPLEVYARAGAFLAVGVLLYFLLGRRSSVGD